MLIDCDLCLARDWGVCDDCVVSFILPMTPGNEGAPLSLEDDEMQALSALAEEGLVPRLRLVTDREPDGEDLAG